MVPDPDVFAVGDIYELLTRDMGDRAILCRHITEGYRGNSNAFYASSVMLLDCARLRHWTWDRDIDEMFAGRLDYGPWVGLTTEDPATIGEIGEEWNSFDKRTPETKLLHNTERSTQPWKTGLPVDYDVNIGPTSVGAAKDASGQGRHVFTRLNGVFRPAATLSLADDVPRYQPHPDPNQDVFFFSLLKQALESGALDEDFVRRRMEADDVRHDAFEVLAKLGYKRSGPIGSAGRLVVEYNLVRGSAVWR